MPLAKRSLVVTLAMPGGNVTLDDTLDLRVNIHKDALAVQNSCTIDVFNLSTTLRQSLLSQFTLWNKRQYQTGQNTGQPAFVNVTIAAGYVETNGQNTSTTIYAGQVIVCEPISGPPKIGIRITCSAQMNDKSSWTTPVPAQMTFKQYAEWVGQQLQVSQTICNTSYDNQIITNPSASTMVRSNLLLDLQGYFRPNVAAFIDNNVLYVRDQGKILTSDTPIAVSEFIETPLWTEWGCKFQCLFDPRITLAAPVAINSQMNPGLNGTYVITSIDYNLTSRQEPFYVVAAGAPSA